MSFKKDTPKTQQRPRGKNKEMGKDMPCEHYCTDYKSGKRILWKYLWLHICKLTTNRYVPRKIS